MISIIFETGIEVKFYTAYYINYEVSGNAWHLYTDKNCDTWVATVPAGSGAVINKGSGIMTNPAKRMTEETAEEMVVDMYESGYHASGENAARIKSALRNFNARTWEWK